MDPQEVLVHHVVDVQKAAADFREASKKGLLLHFLRQTVSANISLIVHLCRSGSASTTGTLDPDAEKKMPPKKQIAGRWYVNTYKRHLSMSIMTFLQVGST